MKRIWLILLGVFILILFSSMAYGEDSTKSFSYTANLPICEHDKSSELELDEGDEITVDVNVIRGGNVDVYLMNYRQYSSAYDEENESSMVISYYEAAENIRTTTITFKAPKEDGGSSYLSYNEFFDSFYVILDNRNCTLTPNDANSIGPVEVDVEIKIKSTTDDTEFPAPDIFIGICVVGGIILLIIIIVIIVYVSRSKDRTRQIPPHYPPAPQQPVPYTPSQPVPQASPAQPQPQQPYPPNQYPSYYPPPYQYYQYPWWQQGTPQPGEPEAGRRPKKKKTKGNKGLKKSNIKK